MRILISSSPGVGHLLPLLPVARAARDRGHEVRIAAGDSLAPIIAAAGFEHETAGPATLGEVLQGSRSSLGLPAGDGPSSPFDRPSAVPSRPASPTISSPSPTAGAPN